MMTFASLELKYIRAGCDNWRTSSLNLAIIYCWNIVYQPYSTSETVHIVLSVPVECLSFLQALNKSLYIDWLCELILLQWKRHVYTCKLEISSTKLPHNAAHWRSRQWCGIRADLVSLVYIANLALSRLLTFINVYLCTCSACSVW